MPDDAATGTPLAVAVNPFAVTVAVTACRYSEMDISSAG